MIPIAFRIAAKRPAQPERQVRLACRDHFRQTKLLGKLIPMIEEVLAAGEIEPPEPPEDAQPVAIVEEKGLGDVGHRY